MQENYETAGLRTEGVQAEGRFEVGKGVKDG